MPSSFNTKMPLAHSLKSMFAADEFKDVKYAVIFHEGFVAHQYLPANLLGRDFIVADLHGSYAMLMDYLKAVNFDPARDRLILVGDLADRGPASFECLMLLLQPWVYAVVGNHESMLLTWLSARESNYYHPMSFIKNGGEWIFELSKAQREMLCGPILQKLLNLPVVITVQDAIHPYHVAHGELMGAGRNAKVLTDKDLTEERVRELVTHITWSRRLLREANASRLSMVQRRMIVDVEGVMMSAAPQEPGLSLTYVGHNIVPRPTLHRSHVYMDRGAYTQDPHSELFAIEHGRFIAGLKNIGLYQ